LLDVRNSLDKVQIDEMSGVGKTQLHERDQTLAARQQLRAFSKLGKQRHCILE
jgi:hypothetical protein